MHRKVNLENQAVYAGLPIGPGQNIDVTPEQYDWLQSQGHLQRATQPPEPDAVALGTEIDCPECGGTGRIAKPAEVVPIVPAGGPEAPDTGKPPAEDEVTVSGRKSIENVGLPVEISQKLVAGGFTTVASVRNVDDEKLDAVDGIGPASIKQIRAATK